MKKLVPMLRWMFALLAVLVMVPGHAEEDYLAPEEAFRLAARMADATHAEVRFEIADGYYMYREQFAFTVQGAELGAAEIPPGKVKYDENFEKDVETYRDTLVIRVPVKADGSFNLVTRYQGCADKGLCYPPMETSVTLSPSEIGKVVTGTEAGGPASDVDHILGVLQSRDLLAILPLFLLLGIGLAFTPCVLPMVPILSSIIVGQGKETVTRSHGFLLSLAYSLGMALVYTALGVTAGLIGEGLSASLQKPWVLVLFALLMVGLSLSMFNVYQLQVPAALQSRLSSVAGRFGGGKFAGVFLMGAVSALIVGPCVAAPLAGILMYISQSQDAVLGGMALFTLAAGMSVPLLLIGLSAGTLLPRAGAWMELVKRFFGVLMLATALWMLSPVLPDVVFIAGWALLGIVYGGYLLRMVGGGRVARVLGMVFVALGLLQAANAVTGGRSALDPLHMLRDDPVYHVPFVKITSVTELDNMLANHKGQLVMLDFYADWCVSCIEMERFTFPDARVKEQMADMLLLQIDVTANNADDRAMLRRFGLFGPPAMIFFDKEGQEIRSSRVIGFQDADRFLSTLLGLQ